MNTSLTRRLFLERTMTPGEIQGAAFLLTDWFLKLYSPTGATLRATVHLWGFPHAEALELQAALGEAAGAQGLPGTVTVSDSDILTIEGAACAILAGEPVPPVSSSLKAAAAAAPPGLLCEVHYTFRAAYERTVVFSGILYAEGLHVRAIWPLGAAQFSEQTYAAAAWSSEKAFLAALDAFWQQGTRTIPAWVRRDLFPTAPGHAVGTFLVWFLQPNVPGLRPFLERVAAALVVIAISSAEMACTRVFPHIVTGFASGLLAVALIGLGFILWQKTRRIVLSRQRMVQNLRKVHQAQIRYPEVVPGSVPGVSEDPAVRKLSADLEALGAQHYKDITIDPPTSGKSLIRLYLLPEESTVFGLLLLYETEQFRLFPSKSTFLLRTRFEDGWRLVSTSGGTAWRLKLPLPMISRLFLDEKAPARMLEKHRAVLHRLTAEGRRTVPLDPDAIIPELIRDHEESGRALAQYGYFSWSDAFHMAFKIPRKEYLEL